MTILRTREDVRHTTASEVVDVLRAGSECVLWLAQSGPDAEALRREGEHVGWWGTFYLRHAAVLDGFEGTVRVGVQLDGAGAWEARRMRRLVSLHLDSAQVELWAGARDLWEGATLADHLAAGYGLDDTRRLTLSDMRSAIEREEDRRVRTPPLVFERPALFARIGPA